MKAFFRRALACISFLELASWAVAGSSIGLGPSSGLADDEIDVPVIFSTTDGVVGVQFDLVYEPATIELLEAPFAGTSIGNHEVNSESIEAGRTRVLVSSRTNQNLADGFLSILPLRLAKTVNEGTDSVTLENVIFADRNGSSISVDLAAFYGAYFGSIGTGEFALFVRPDQSAVFLAHIPSSDTGILNLNVSIDQEGAFSFQSEDGANVTGAITGSLVSGRINPPDVAFSGTQSQLLGENLAQAGIYEAAVVNSASGLTYSIIGADGRTYLYVNVPGAVDGGSGTVNLNGEGTITTSGGANFSILADAVSDRFSGTFSRGDESGQILGLAEGAERDDRLVNISTRGQVKTDARKMIAGFVISGSGTKQVLIRAIGPTLGDFGVPGTLENPLLEIFRSGEASPFSSNDNWGSLDEALVSTATARLGGFPLGQGSEDSVLLLDLGPGGYTAQVSGVSEGIGVGLVEVYDGDDPALGTLTSDVVNISTRGEIGTSSDVLIAGFVINGTVPKRVLIRGIGPTLGAFGVPETIADPRLELFAAKDGAGAPPFTENDNWEEIDGPAIAAAAAVVGGFPLGPGSKDAAILIWLEPGVYTATVSGVSDGTGIGLVEVYELP